MERSAGVPPATADAIQDTRKTVQRLILDAPAKVNWVLNVLGKRPDGYHEIDTLMQTISLADRLTVEAIPGGGAVSGGTANAEPRVTCSDPSLPTGPENLVWRAWEAMRRAFPGRVGAVSIHIEKRIPHGAGLGGGSSDAAAALRALDEIFALGASLDHLSEIAAEIGSDAPFFIRGGLARARGRGEIIEPIDLGGAAGAPPALNLVALFPGFASPTAAAYRALNAPPFREGDTGEARRIEAAARAIATGDAAALAAAMANAFDAALVGEGTPYAEIKQRMAAEGLVGAMLSGSGSAVIALARSAERAQAAALKLARSGAPAFAVRTVLGMDVMD